MIQIAITDDHTIVIEGIKTMLKSNKEMQVVQTFENLKDTYEHLDASVDVLLLDINLPDMDGFEVMRCLREQPSTKSIPVVAVSANAMEQDLARGMAAGFADYVTKPIDVGRLLRVVEELTAHKP